MPKTLNISKEHTIREIGSRFELEKIRDVW